MKIKTYSYFAILLLLFLVPKDSLTSSMYSMWYETLPSECPPKEALPAPGRIVYRFVNNNPPIDSCFHSMHKEGHNLTIGGEVTECIVRALSVWETEEIARKKSKLPALKNKLMAKVILSETDGPILKTFGKGHYSWWRKSEFKPTSAIVV